MPAKEKTNLILIKSGYKLEKETKNEKQEARKVKKNLNKLNNNLICLVTYNFYLTL